MLDGKLMVMVAFIGVVVNVVLVFVLGEDHVHTTGGNAAVVVVMIIFIRIVEVDVVLMQRSRSRRVDMAMITTITMIEDAIRTMTIIMQIIKL